MKTDNSIIFSTYFFTYRPMSIFRHKGWITTAQLVSKVIDLGLRYYKLKLSSNMYRPTYIHVHVNTHI